MLENIRQAFKNYQAINQFNQNLKKHFKLHVADIVILDYLSQQQEGVYKKQLEHQTQVPTTISSGAIKRLKKEGYIQRRRDEDNDTLVILSMNDEMRKKAKSLFEEIQLMEAEIEEEQEKEQNKEQNETSKQPEKETTNPDHQPNHNNPKKNK